MEKQDKERLDVLVSRKVLFPREYSKKIIEDGKVIVNGKKMIKPGEKIDVLSDIIVNAEKMKYVGRGGYKLEKAFEVFSISVKNKVCIDVGASTGGFTDCMIQNGARKVFAIDVGTAQLDKSLLDNEKVISMEKTNIQNVDKNIINENIDFICVDVSFVSIIKIAGAVSNLLGEDGEAVFLIKPQFEAGKSFVGKKGVVKNPKIHKKVINDIYVSMKEYRLNPVGLSYSPISGQNGNIEYLIYVCKNRKSIDEDAFNIMISNVVENAFIKTVKSY